MTKGHRHRLPCGAQARCDGKRGGVLAETRYVKNDSGQVAENVSFRVEEYI